MRRGKGGGIVFDTSVLVEMASGSELGKLAYEIITEGEFNVITTEL